MTLRFSLPDDTSWAQAVHLVAWDQFQLTSPKRDFQSDQDTPAELEESPLFYEISMGNYAASVDKRDGSLFSLRGGDAELLKRPMVPNFWKHPNSNQWGNQYPIRLGI